MAKLKEKELVHWFKVAIVEDPKDAHGANSAAKALMEVGGVTDVDFLRSTMRTVAGE